MPDKFTSFILEHSQDDTTKLLLGKNKWPDIDVPLAVSCINVRKKLRNKVPEFYDNPFLIYPFELSAEQSSSTATALYKASLASRICQGRIADLTGGLGVDSAAFSKFFDKVLYNEMRGELSQASEKNFIKLGIRNIEVSNIEITPENVAEVVERFKASLVYMDPARRSSLGSKVFRLEDCSPDVLKLKEEIFKVCRHLLLKLSPMADINLICKQLGESCREVHVVGNEGECKEVLVWMDREHKGDDYDIHVRDEDTFLVFTRDTEKNSSVTFPRDEEQLKSFRYLFEPSKAVLKSGAYKLLSERFGCVKLSGSAHLYVSGEKRRFPGKTFEISCILPLNKKNLKEAALRWPRSEVTSRNLPLGSDELRKKMGVRSGEDAHIFAVGCSGLGNWLLICHRILSE